MGIHIRREHMAEKKSKKASCIMEIISNTIFRVLLLFAFFTIAFIAWFRYEKLAKEAAMNDVFVWACQMSDRMLESVRSYYGDIYRSIWNKKDVDQEELQIIFKQMHTGEVIDSVYLYDGQTDMFFGNAAGGCAGADFWDQEIREMIQKKEKEEELFVRERVEMADGNRLDMLTYFFREEGGQRALIVNIDLEKYQHLIWGALGSLSVEVTMVHREDESKNIDKDGTYYVFRQESCFSENAYIGKVKREDLFAEIYFCSSGIMVLMAGIVLFEIACSFIFAKKMYVPLRKVVDHANSMVTEEDGCCNEYELIDAALSRLETNAGKMKTTQHRYRQNVKKEILRKLLYGDGNQIHKAELEEVGIVWERDTFCVVTASFNHLESLKEVYSHSDIKLFCFMAINIVEEYLKNAGYTAYGVDCDDYTVSIILQLESEYEREEIYTKETFPLENTTEIQKVLYGAKTELERILKSITVFIGVGRSVKKYEDIHRSWLDTQYATIYRFTRGDQLITLFTAHMESYESGIQYPWDIEKKLLTNIKTAQEAVILSTLNEFFSAVQKMAPDEMRWAINQIMTSIFRLGMMNNYKMKDGSPLDWKSWVNELNATDTKYEMKDVLVLLLKNLSIEEEDNDSIKKKLADCVKKYVENHFYEDTLSVSDIASHIGYSVNYVRLIFKEAYGISVSDYILEKRIERAQQLLAETNYTSKKIAQMVGYPDNRYFYVVFKKKTGETTETFRKNSRS